MVPDVFAWLWTFISLALIGHIFLTLWLPTLAVDVLIFGDRVRTYRFLGLLAYAIVGYGDFYAKDNLLKAIVDNIEIGLAKVFSVKPVPGGIPIPIRFFTPAKRHLGEGDPHFKELTKLCDALIVVMGPEDLSQKDRILGKLSDVDVPVIIVLDGVPRSELPELDRIEVFELNLKQLAKKYFSGESIKDEIFTPILSAALENISPYIHVGGGIRNR